MLCPADGEGGVGGEGGEGGAGGTAAGELLDKCGPEVELATEPDEGDASMDYKPQKNWRKSITNFFRAQPRSTKSNDGDHMSSLSHDGIEEKEMSPEQKWQSLGKLFRRQSSIDNWGRSPEHRNRHGEPSAHGKRHGIKKMFTQYFQKNPSSSKDKEEEN